MPERIRLRRTKGWRKPRSAVVVARPSKWGNPFRIGVDGDAETCVAKFRGWVAEQCWDLAPLRGRDLCCWCTLDGPCHADVLLELANRKDDQDRNRSL